MNSTQEYCVFWFRRDLRLHDNAGLYHALKSGLPVKLLFIFDTEILSKLSNKADARVHFIHSTLVDLHAELNLLGAGLQVEISTPLTIFERFATDINCKAVYCNTDYEPYALERDKAVETLLKKANKGFHAFKDSVIFDGTEVLKDDLKPYTVFTPYSKKWLAKLSEFYLKAYPSERLLIACDKVPTLGIPTLQDIGFEPSSLSVPSKDINLEIVKHYHTQRDYPAINGTSRLSVHLRFGTLSIRALAQLALKHNAVWLNELIWRDFYQMIIFHFPNSCQEAFKPAYNRIEWRNEPAEFEAWCTGNTGYPLVDAGMRELNTTGFMHNRVRMLVASFLCKHLLIDWRWGEAYFAEKLLDYDLASNVGGWQWAAGSGCDAAPYFRVFSPDLQTLKFDKDLVYIKKWVPEFQELSYTRPIVEHKFARERVLNRYKAALSANP